MTKATETSRVKISIARNTVWAGSGILEDGVRIVDCAAQLGSTPDETEEIYSAIEDAIAAGENMVRWGLDGEVNFTWALGQ